MENTKEVFGEGIFKYRPHSDKKHAVQSKKAIKIVLDNQEKGPYEKKVVRAIDNQWVLENKNSMACDIGSYANDAHLLKRDVFEYASDQTEDGLLLSDDKGKVFGAFRINHRDSRIMNETYNVRLQTSKATFPGALLDAVLENQDKGFLYVTPFTYADWRKAG